SLVDEFVEQYVEEDKELIELVKECLPEQYDGSNHRLLVQDIFYQILEKSRGVNYWIFQGNPKAFDFETALREDLVDDWTVSAHKDKIKPGDKVIIWITGEKAGCYALAEVVSEPYEKLESSDAHLWKTENTNSLKADIKVTHNLIKKPITKEDIDGIEALKDLKVGNQGTNFSSTSSQYEEIVRIAKSRESFAEIKSKFKPAVLENYAKHLRKMLAELNLKPDDERLVFSVKGSGLHFTIGQRYCFNLFVSNQKGSYGVISKDKLLDESNPFDGKPPQPFYNYYKEFSPTESDWLSIKEALKDELARTNKSGFRKHNDKEFENFVLKMSSKEDEKEYALNTILYGPPGTGKTYNTVKMAAEIVSKRAFGKDEYKAALTVFNEAKKNGQIEFITFHQNYSYEDFIQGLRPDTENDSQLTFDRTDGVFKIIADNALLNLQESDKPKASKKPFEDVFNDFTSSLIEGDAEEIEVKMKKVSFFITGVTNKSIQFRKASGGTAHSLSISTLRKMYAAESVLDIQGLASYYKPLVQVLLKKGKDQTGKIETVEKKNYVIIIDEINRANISRVFGELITLIEPDKRSHGEIPMEAKLPSGDTFMVPSNLHIIGTMNTADKSIALLDIALRRRFEFVPMYPKYSEDGLDVRDENVLRLMNEAIVSDKGHDFQIGHSYFMDSAQDPYDFKKRMNVKVIPLLLEYFMNDVKDVTTIVSNAIKETGYKIDAKAWPLTITKING
ncbi:EVE domain-containing protein, partial [Flavobacteriales bacterium]|nr:EVE domain-containing protein [Flavobacteriales bacterium]